MASLPFKSLSGATGTADGTAKDLEAIRESHEAYFVVSGFSGTSISAYLELSPDGVNWWTPPETINANITGNGVYHISNGQTPEGPVIALARYIRASVIFTSASASVDGWVLSK
jgi:hypothetical protein